MCGETRNPGKQKSLQHRLYQKLSGHISLYITEQRYPPDCSQDKKRAIGEKAAMFNVRKGVLFIKKKKKSMVRPDFS